MNEQQFRIQYKRTYGSTKNAVKAWKRKTLALNKANRKKQKQQ